MNKRLTIYLVTAVVAFCSLSYELLLGQLLSAFLGNTVLRYSVTIGLYMLAMGIGAALAEGRAIEKPIKRFVQIELLLTLIGGGAVLGLALLVGFGIPLSIFSLIAHTLIIIIGILTGTEIPLLIVVNEMTTQEEQDHIILGVDYIGALFGAILFAVFFYPTAGLTFTASVIALMNALAGLLLILFVRDTPLLQYTVTLGLLGCMLIGAIVFNENLHMFVVNQYIQ